MLQLSLIKFCKSARFERRFAAAGLIWVIPHQHFKSTLLGVGHKKEYAVYARENDDNSGRPLRNKCLLQLMSAVSSP